MTPDGERQIIQYLQIACRHLKNIDKHLAVMSGADGVGKETSVYYNLPSEKTNALLAILTAALLPSAPEVCIPVVVTNTEVLLAANETVDLQQYTITNDSFAQSIWIGPMGVQVSSGTRLPPLGALTFVLPPAAAIYGRCIVPTVSARISRGYPIGSIIGPYLKRG